MLELVKVFTTQYSPTEVQFGGGGGIAWDCLAPSILKLATTHFLR